MFKLAFIAYEGFLLTKYKNNGKIKMTKERVYKVYMHTNLINNKKYVGVTKQKIERRWKNGNGYKHCIYFYNAIQKYGWDNFKHEVLFQNLTSDEAEMFEVELIKHYKSNDSKYGYNIQSGGKLNTNFNEEHRKKLSKIQKEVNKRPEIQEMRKEIGLRSRGIKRPNELVQQIAEKHCKPIICLENKKIYDSIRIASQELNIDASSISAVCKNKRNTAGNLHFMYIQDYNSNNEYKLKYNKRKVVCLNTGEIFDSIQSAYDKYHINHISEICNGKIKSIKGFIFKYLEDYERNKEQCLQKNS